MKTFLQYIKNTNLKCHSYKINIKNKDQFFKFLIILRKEYKTLINIKNNKDEIIVCAPIEVHNRINLIWNNH